MSQRIIRLVSENVKRIKAVDLHFDPAKPLVIIRGNNAEGKSSLIDTIAYILGGKRIQPPKLIREGESYARALLETEELIVERKWKSNAESTVEVRSKEGAKFKSPQAMLDALTSRISFDPLHFMNLPPADQATTLRKIVGLDFAKLDGRRLKFYDDRTEVNRELSSLQKRLAAMPVEAAPLARVDVAALLEQQRVLEDQAIARQQADDQLIHADNAVVQATEIVKRAEETVAASYAKKKAAVAARAAAVAKLEALGATGAEASKRSELATRIATASDHNERARKQEERNGLAEKVTAQTDQAATLTRSIEAIDLEKEQLTTSAAFPVPGLGFAAEGVTYKGLPLEQASGAEKIRVSTGIGFALNPELRVLKIQDGSLLDAKSLKLLEELAEKADGQIFLEAVGTEGVGIVIEDGSVAMITETGPYPEKVKESA